MTMTALLLALVLTAPAPTLPRLPQDIVPADSVRPEGVLRASATVDSVFVDRQLATAFVPSGDWAAYLMARLGIYPIPPDLKIEVLSDTLRIVLRTRVGDLPAEARLALGPIVAFLPPETIVAGEIGLQKIAREVVRFRLEAVRVNDLLLPEPIVQSVMSEVGERYPALTRSGRALLIQIPRDADVQLAVGGVNLVGPPAEPPAGR